MAEERKRPISKHTMSMENREVLQMTGIIDVISFDEEVVIAETDTGALVIKGLDLHISKLDIESGKLDIEGKIDSFIYEDESAFSKHKGGFFGKIFK